MRAEGRWTVCGHDGSEHWFDLVHRHHAMCEKCLQKHPMDVSVGLIIWYIAHKRCFVPRHEGCVSCVSVM
jgi:hypothetical protein